MGLAAAAYAVDRARYVHIDDAGVSTDLIQLAVEAPGRVTAVHAAPGASVAEGAPLLDLDAREARESLEELKAALAAILAEDAEAGLETDMLEVRLAATLAQSAAHLSAEAEAAAAARSDLALAERDLARLRDLSKSGLIARAALDRAEARLAASRHARLRAEAMEAAARARLAEEAARRREIDIARAGRAVLDARAEELRRRIAAQRITLERRTLTAPRSGRIDEVFAAAGDHVREGQRVMVMHDPANIWVEARVRERDIARIRLGAAARVRLDGQPGVSLTGRVTQIGGAAEGAFRILPPAGAAGGIARVAERVQLRIDLALPREGAVSPRPGGLARVRIEAQ